MAELAMQQQLRSGLEAELTEGGVYKLEAALQRDLE